MKEKLSSTALIPLAFLLGVIGLLGWAPNASAYDQWSSCAACHGGFTATYTFGGWTTNLHDVHRNTMLGGDCDTCHFGSSRKPVYTYQSNGGTGFAAIGCSGCHDGPGLRQHHRRAGASTCSGCHTNPETPQAENVRRPYYFTPDTAHPNKPTDPCGITKTENFGGPSTGLDNDGNGLYDSADAACAGAAAPTASAGPNQTVNEGATVTLNGSNSTGAGLTYRWTQTAGTPTVTLATPNAVSATFTAPSVGSTGVALTFQLTVTNSSNQTASATTTVNVSNVNQAPVANAGSNQTVNEGSPVTLNGSSSSDADGSIASYAWTQTTGTAVTLSNPAAPNPSFAAPSVGATGASLTFRLTVTDNGGLTASATTIVNVTDATVPNVAPVANAGPNQTVAEGAPVTLIGSGSSDADGTIAAYAWTQMAGPSVTLSGPAAANPNFTAPAVGAAGTSLTFRLTVTDNGGLSATATTIVNVAAVTATNQPPVANAGPDQTVAAGTAVTLSGSNSSDSDGTVVSYLWEQTAGPSVTLSGPTAVAATFTAPEAGALSFRLTVVDDGGLSASDTVSVNITAVALGPSAAAGPNQTVRPGTTVTLDAGNSTDAVTYLWAQTAGAPVALSDPQGAVTTFVAPNAGPALAFDLTVTDAGGLTSTDTIIVNVSDRRHAPRAEAGKNRTVKEKMQVTLDGSGSTASEGSIVSYRWRQIRGTAVTLSDPTAARPTFITPEVGRRPVSLKFRLTVTDDHGLSDTDRVIVNVTNDKRPPFASPGHGNDMRKGETRTLDGSTSSDSDERIQSYQWRQTRGTAVLLSDPAAPVCSFTAQADASEDDLEFELTVTADSGLQDSNTVAFRVAASQASAATGDSSGGGSGGGGCFITASEKLSPSRIWALGAIVLVAVFGFLLKKKT